MIAYLVALASLAVAPQSSQNLIENKSESHISANESNKDWHASISLSGENLFDLYYKIGLAGTYYFNKLKNDIDHPLSLLAFYQHPDSLTIQSYRLSPNGGNDAAYSANVSTIFFPWKTTGFSMGLSADNIANSYKISRNVSMHLGVQTYFRPNILLGVEFNRSDDSYVYNKSSSNGLSINSTVVLCNDRLQISAEIKAQLIKEETEIYYTNTRNYYSGMILTQYFANRNISIAINVHGALDHRNNNDIFYDSTSSNSYYYALSPILQFWLVDNWHLDFAYEHIIRHSETQRDSFNRINVTTGVYF